MKMQKAVILVNKSLQINILQMKIIVIGAEHRICKLKNSMPKEIPKSLSQ